MKPSPVMFFEYLGMIGVPVLLLALALAAILSAGAFVMAVLLLTIAAGCILYGVIGLREAFFHGGNGSEKTPREE